ncbi:MAG: hypothetical protein HYV96_18315 [Opitutae bacterium]|nr:hypothetical protein [Opitutae bacterium]
MSTRRIHAFAAAFLGFAAAASAQTIQFVSVTRQAAYVQTGATVSDLSADPTTPFRFRAAVEGDSGTTATNPWTAVTVTPPGGSATSMTFNTGDKQWQFEDTTPTSMANLNATYGTGGYTFTPTGTPSGTATVTVGSFAASLLNIPLLTLSGGSWVGGSYVISNTAMLTVTFNAVFTGTPGATDGFHFDSRINGSTSMDGANDFANWDPTTNAAANYPSTPPAFIVGAGQLAAGSYTIEASYDDIQNPASVYGSAFSASLFELRTTVNLTVVPEPAALAAAFGALALLGVFARRRLLVA